MPAEMKHTPGPWKVENPIDNFTAWAVCANTPDGVHITPVAHIEPITAEGCAVKRDDVQQMANARLIAAAPDLLGVLKSWITFCDNLEGKPATRTSAEHMEAIRNDARAAIAKAEGR